ncbi:MAG: hypothetical protein QM763_06580 [Agriterribacter sp.]
MITIQMLRIYERYKGDVDRYTRASRKELSILSEADFFIISRFISDLKLIGNGVAAASYEAQVFEQINNLVDNDQTKEYLLKLSKVLS